MADKILNTRIQLKHDTLANWQSKNTLLKKGEIAIAVIEAVDPANKLHQPVMFKVGPGNFNDLEWASALAADVYAWAKKAGIDVTDNGTGNVVSDITWDAASQALVVTRIDVYTKAEADEKFQEAGNYKTVQTAVSNKITDAAHVLTSLTQNANGEVAYEVKELTPADIGAQPAGNYQPAGDYKTKQTAYSNNGTTAKTITEVTQNENGEIAVTYADIAFPEVTLPTVEDAAVDGQFVTEVDQTNGAIAVTRKAIEVAHADGQIYLTIDGKKIGTGFSDADFIKDGFLQSVTKDVANNTITFTWNTDAGVDTTVIDIDDLVEVYTGAEGIDITDFEVKIADAGVTTVKIADKNVTEAKLSDDVTAKLNKEWQPVGNYKTTQTAVSDPTANGKSLTFIDTIAQNANGEITATKKEVNLDDYALKSELPTVNDGKFTVSGTGYLTGTGEMTANQAGNTTADIDLSEATKEKIDGAVQSVTAGVGIKATRTGNAINLDIVGKGETDEDGNTVVFIFDCGGAE